MQRSLFKILKVECLSPPKKVFPLGICVHCAMPYNITFTITITITITITFTVRKTFSGKSSAADLRIYFDTF